MRRPAISCSSRALARDQHHSGGTARRSPPRSRAPGRAPSRIAVRSRLIASMISSGSSLRGLSEVTTPGRRGGRRSRPSAAAWRDRGRRRRRTRRRGLPPRCVRHRAQRLQHLLERIRRMRVVDDHQRPSPTCLHPPGYGGAAKQPHARLRRQSRAIRQPSTPSAFDMLKRPSAAWLRHQAIRAPRRLADAAASPPASEAVADGAHAAALRQPLRELARRPRRRGSARACEARRLEQAAPSPRAYASIEPW